MQSWTWHRTTENFIYCLIPHELVNNLEGRKQYQTIVVLPMHTLRNRGLLCRFPFRKERKIRNQTKISMTVLMSASITTMIRYEDNDKNILTGVEAPTACGHTFNPWLYSPLLDLGRFFSFLILHTVGIIPWTGDEPFVGSWSLIQFLNLTHSRYDSLDGKSARRKAAT
jgi:hypothetical protein